MMSSTELTMDIETNMWEKQILTMDHVHPLLWGVHLFWLVVFVFTLLFTYPYMDSIVHSLKPTARTWKMDGRKTNFLLGSPIFRGYVSFRESSLPDPQ